MELDLIWFDSMGAKSSCTMVRTADTTILIDPGAAIMQPSFPLPMEKKIHYLSEAERKIKEASLEADHIVISHYHYDHLKVGEGAEQLYKNKELWIKDPNQWINHSQWGRAREFLKWISKIEGEHLHYTSPKNKVFEDPLNNLPIAASKIPEYYQDRKEEAIEKWNKRFLKLQNDWTRKRWVETYPTIHFADSSGFDFGSTKVRFTPPLFHGIEYANTGWIICTIIEDKDTKFIHTSDIHGPMIEDYAQWIIDENPNILILDGPATYLLGYLLNATNLERSIKNAVSIIEECDLDLMIYDHHLLRDRHYRERTARVWETAEEMGINLMTAAEYNGTKPVVFGID